MISSTYFRPSTLLTFVAELALLVDLVLRDRPARPFGVGLAFLLAALCKEMALALAFALPAWHLACRREEAVRPSALWKRAKDRGELGVYAAILGAGLLLPPDQVGQAQDLLAQLEGPARWVRLGDLWLTRGNPQEALGAFEQAGLLGAQLADVAAGQSAALIDLRAWGEAEALLSSALATAPNDARLHNNLGVVARGQGNLEAARQHFARAVELAPDWEQPRLNLEALEIP